MGDPLSFARRSSLDEGATSNFQKIFFVGVLWDSKSCGLGFQGPWVQGALSCTRGTEKETYRLKPPCLILYYEQCAPVFHSAGKLPQA